jgi:glycosyltransferase involved in cell wall biosynthesis
VVVTNSFKDILADRGIAAEKIFVVPNGADLSRFAPRARSPALRDGVGLARNAFVAGYVGTHGMAHGLETLLDAADILARTPAASAIRIVMLGDGARKAKLIERADRLGLENLLFLDSVHKDEVADYWALLDISLIHLKKEPLFTTVIPSKLFECMAMGLPVLHGVEGESAEIVRQEQVGETFEPENAPALAAAILRLSNDHTSIAQYRNNAVAAARRFDRAVLAARMLDILRGI